jgi:hypothetical protein
MSTLTVTNISDGTDTVATGYVVSGSAKAWASYNGQGTVSTRQSFNVSSMTDISTGTYTFQLVSGLSGSGVIGSAWNSPAEYGSTAEYPVQSAGYATASFFKAICGSNATDRFDWFTGSAGCMGDLA